MTDLLLQLGYFSFMVNTVAPQTIGRSKAYRWAWNERMGALASGQYTGPGEETFTLEGTWYAEFASANFTIPQDADPLADLREMASLGMPVALVDGLGKVYGQFVVLNVTQTGGPFYMAGIPRKIDFNVTLRKWSD